MVRHDQKRLLKGLIKRGLCIVSALIIIVCVPVVHADDSALIRVSYVNFYSRRTVDTSTGVDVVNNDDWIVIDFNLDGYYTGTIEYWCQFQKPVLAIPELTAVGTFYTVTSETTNDGTVSATQKDTFTFHITNCQHFQIIYHLSSSGGIYFNGTHALTGGSLNKEDGSSVPGISTDYTDILNGLKLDLDSILSDTNVLNSTTSSILDTLNTIKTDLDSMKNINMISWYSRDLYMWLLRSQYTVVNDGSNLVTSMGWGMKRPDAYNNYPGIYLDSTKTYTMVLYTDNTADSNIKLNLQASDENYKFYFRRVNTIRIYGSLKVANVKVNTSGYYRIAEFTNNDYVYPVYFGLSQSIPEEVRVLSGLESTPTLLEKIVSLFQQNNKQNEEISGKLDDVIENQGTINESIEGFNSDMNSALANVPLGETTQQLNQMQGAFEATNNWIQQIYNALGKLQIIIIIGLILALIQIFRGKKT